MKRHKRLGRWRYMVTVLAAVIIFSTVYALILPAITMERSPDCGIAEHTHGESCYDESGTLICTLEEHEHTAECYSDTEEPTEEDPLPEEEAVVEEEPVEEMTAAPTEAEETQPTEEETEAATEFQTEPPTEKPSEVERLSFAKKGLFANVPTGSDQSSDDKISYEKQIEKLSADEDDYHYRLHLTVDGGALQGSSTESTTGETGGKKAALVIDVTRTMTATDGAFGGTNKFAAVQRILNGEDGFIKQFLSGEDNEISIILVWGVSGGSSYSQLYSTVSSKNTADGIRIKNYADVPNAWNEEHHSTGLSYTTGLLAVNDIYPGEDVSIIYIAGNEPGTYVKTSDGNNEMGTNGSNARTKNYNDSVAWLNAHPNYTLYGVGINDEGTSYLNDGSTTTHTMKDIAEATGGAYFSADNADGIKDIFTEIIEIIIPGDTTKNISLTDTLSGNVTFAEDQAMTAILRTGDGFMQAEDVSGCVTVENGTVSFSRADEIEGPFKLEVAFNIKTAEGVYKDTQLYPDTGYPDTGEADTDYGSNISAGKPGYFSNSAGELSYSLNGTGYSKTFNKPVVQAPEKLPDTARINVTKHWSGNLSPKAVTMTLYEKDGSLFREAAVITLTAGQDAQESYTYTFERGETEKTLYLVESSDADSLPVYSGTSEQINPGSGTLDAAVITLTPNAEEAVTVTNWPKARMPETGGVGSAPFIVTGLLMTLLAVSMLIRQKQRRDRTV